MFFQKSEPTMARGGHREWDIECKAISFGREMVGNIFDDQKLILNKKKMSKRTFRPLPFGPGRFAKAGQVLYNQTFIFIHKWNQNQIFIGGLRDDANKYDIEDTFSKYGRVS